MPQKYRVILDNQQFKEKSEINLIYCCGVCKAKSDESDIDIFDYHLNALESLTTDEKTIRAWNCPECTAINHLSDTEIEKDMLAQPSYLQTVPTPPERKNGLLGRATYRKEFSAWAWNFLEELEEKMAQFRDDNWSKDSEFKGYNEIDTTEEESED